MEKRAGKKAALLAADDKLWEIESYYIAQAIVDYIMILSPQKIVLGGGVMKQEQLFPMIREQVIKLLGGYINTKEIVPASLNGDQGIMGCMKLAYDAFGDEA